jgi:predicted ATPase/class 3 adenylate cyclase
VPELPSGTVTFLFTDLEGSTRLWEGHPDEMQEALARHDAILRDAVEAHDGHVVKTTGDGVHAAFAVASDAIDAAVSAQLALQREEWAETGPLRVRMGIHSGAAEIRDGDYYGTALNRAARLMSVAHGGQIVVSLTTRDLLRDSPIDLVDLGEHRLRDLGEPEHVHQVAHTDLPADFPPLRSVENFATNLPLQTTSFVGRDDDMADVMDALEHARVVTLTGVGGVGKTRLAIQVAAELLPRYRDGAWLVELGPLNTSDGLPELLAAALVIQPRQGMTTAQGIVDALRSRQMLVVFDNCEHVIGAAARMVDDIVRSCPDVRILATSREGLGVRGERQITVRSLDLEVESVELFVERAHDAGGRFERDEGTQSAIAQICTRLDGIPLALELAAARTRMMTPAEVATRLDERFRLLTGGSRTAVERHQTLRQAVDWSYDLLEPRERTILDRLGVFAGGFTLDAAEAVASGDAVDALDVMDGIAQLVDKSLVVAEPEEGGTRYRLLETIRQYALERLDDAGAADAVRRRHAEWCADFIAHVSIGVRGRDEVQWLQRLDRELDNIRAGVTWAAEVDDADLALRQLGQLGSLSLGQRAEGYRLCPLAAVALSASDAEHHPRAAMAFSMRGVDHLHHDEIDDAYRDADEAVRLVRAGESDLLVEPWVAHVLTRMFSGTLAYPSEELDDFLRISSDIGDDYLRCTALGMAAGWFFALNRVDDARPYAFEVFELAEQLGNPSARSMARFALGGVLMESDPDRARTLLLESVELGQQLGNDFFVGMALGRISRISADANDPLWAHQFRQALDTAVDNGDRRIADVLIDVHAQALLATGHYESAARLFGYAWEHTRHIRNPYSAATVQRAQPLLRGALGDERFDALLEQGAALPFEDAVALVRAELDRVIEGVPSDS